MRVAIIGAGVIGTAIKRLHPDAALFGRGEPVRYDWFDVVIDTAWNGSNDRKARNNSETQSDSYWEARNRIDRGLKTPSTRYVMMGSQDEFQHGTDIPEWRQSRYCRGASHYGMQKIFACACLLDQHPRALWLRLSSVVHRNLPMDTLFRKAADSDALAFDPTALWNCLPLDVAAEAIYQMACSDMIGVANLGSIESYPLGDLVHAVNPELEILAGESYSVHMVVEKAKPYIAEHDIFETLAELGKEWRRA